MSNLRSKLAFEAAPSRNNTGSEVVEDPVFYRVDMSQIG